MYLFGFLYSCTVYNVHIKANIKILIYLEKCNKTNSNQLLHAAICLLTVDHPCRFKCQKKRPPNLWEMAQIPTAYFIHNFSHWSTSLKCLSANPNNTGKTIIFISTQLPNVSLTYCSMVHLHTVLNSSIFLPTKTFTMAALRHLVGSFYFGDIYTKVHVLLVLTQPCPIFLNYSMSNNHSSKTWQSARQVRIRVGCREQS